MEFDYREMHPMPLWEKLGWLLGIVCLPRYLARFGVTVHVPIGLLIFMGTGCAFVILIILWSRRRYEVRVGGGKLQAGYIGMLQSVDVNDIVWVASQQIGSKKENVRSCDAVEGAKWTVFRRGPGVRVRIRGRRYDWVFSTDNPDAVARALGMELLGHPPGVREKETQASGDSRHP